MKHERNTTLTAAVVGDDVEQLSSQTKIEGNWGLMVGREDTGLSADWIRHCQQQLSISMPGGTDSLNVAVATSIILYQLTV